VAKRKKTSDDRTSTPATTKDPHAVALGRKGGLRGGPARARKLTPKQRSESARKAVVARWAKYRAALNDAGTKGGSKKTVKKGSRGD
jgi:hypothetical protein